MNRLFLTCIAALVIAALQTAERSRALRKSKSKSPARITRLPWMAT